MKNFFKTIGIIAVAAVIGLSMTACGEEESDPPPQIPQQFRGTWVEENDGNTRTLVITADSMTITSTDGSSFSSGTLKGLNSGSSGALSFAFGAVNLNINSSNQLVIIIDDSFNFKGTYNKQP
jgi:hypothetical protein